MFKYVVFVPLLVHGLIHLMGFFKAFGLAELRQLTKPISKPVGIIWLLTCFVFLFSAFQVISGQELWWQSAGAGIFVSQILVVVSWRDAKVGTLANALITCLLVSHLL